MIPAFVSLFRSGELAHRVEHASGLQSPCRLCPHACRAARGKGEKGFCGGEARAKLFRCAPHFGEEPPLTGSRGSGTVFFSGCTLRCTYCQNYYFSQDGAGREVACDELARIFLDLKEQGCHNLNLVTPTHWLPQILAALHIATGNGFDLPVVYNSSGYESLETLRLLDGCVDIYLADMRYSSRQASARYSGAADYPDVNRAAIREMWRQVGRLVTGGEGIAQRGLIARHLVLPGGVAGTEGVCRFLAREVSADVSFSLMSQYTPCHRAVADPVLGRRISREEFDEACVLLDRYGLTNGWVQEWHEEGTEERYLGAVMRGNV